MMRLTMKARQEVTKATAGQYRGASKKEKGKILDQSMATTGYSRWYARQVLRHEVRRIQTDKQTISCQSFITQNSSQQIMIWNELNLYHEYRVDLIRDGDSVSYIKEAKEGIESAERQPPSGSSALLIMESGREYSLHQIHLKDWTALLVRDAINLRFADGLSGM